MSGSDLAWCSASCHPQTLSARRICHLVHLCMSVLVSALRLELVQMQAASTLRLFDEPGMHRASSIDSEDMIL